MNFYSKAAAVICLSVPLLATAKPLMECYKEIGTLIGEEKQAAMRECLADGVTETPDAPKDPKIYVVDFGILSVNSADGVEPYAILTNPSKSSPIKYIQMVLTLYNQVGDPVASTIGGGSTKTLKFTGPLSYDNGDTKVEWGPVWYNGTGSCISMQSLTVEFMNGKLLKFFGKGLRPAIASTNQNNCRFK